MTPEEAVARAHGIPWSDLTPDLQEGYRRTVATSMKGIRQWLSDQGGDLLEPTDDGGWRAVKAEHVGTVIDEPLAAGIRLTDGLDYDDHPHLYPGVTLHTLTTIEEPTDD
jgi:hypothetical protein